jgi:hypothetical protein
MLVGAARIYEELDDLANSTLFYRDALKIDAMNFEALACVGMECYYDDQAELALRYYRSVLYSTFLWRHFAIHFKFSFFHFISPKNIQNFLTDVNFFQFSGVFYRWEFTVPKYLSTSACVATSVSKWTW